MLKMIIALGVLIVIACVALLTSCDWSQNIVNKINGHEEVDNVKLSEGSYE